MSHQLKVRTVYPATNGNGEFHVVSCPDHPDADLTSERVILPSCDCSWSCKHPTGKMVYTCPDCGRTGGYTF